MKEATDMAVMAFTFTILKRKWNSHCDFYVTY